MSKEMRGRRAPSAPVNEAEMERLLTGAGRRPEVPARDLAVIRAAARAEWQELVAGRQKRRLVARRLVPLTAAAGLVLALILGWWWRVQRSPVAPAPIATVKLLKGDAQVQDPPDRGSERLRRLTGDETLVAGTTLATAAGQSAGIVALRLSGGESLRLAAGTRVRLVAPDRVALANGTLYVDSQRPAVEGVGLEIATALGTVRELGTQFEVRVATRDAAALRVRVRDGAVAVVRGAESHAVRTGEELRMQRDGAVERGKIDRHGAAWQWVLDAAPGLDIEDPPLATVLHWVSRETGWEVRFAPPELAASVGPTVVRGSLQGLAPDEAVRVALPASNLDYRLEDGVLLIQQP